VHTRTEVEDSGALGEDMEHNEARDEVDNRARVVVDNAALGMGHSEVLGRVEDKQDRLAQVEAQAEVGEGSKAEVQGKEHSVALGKAGGKQDRLAQGVAHAEVEKRNMAEVLGKERIEALGKVVDRLGRQAGVDIEVAEDKKPQEVVQAEAEVQAQVHQQE